MDKIPIPNKLYGREQDVAVLLELFEQISRDYGAVLLVHGSSGAGKTSLINELQLPVLNRNGFFVNGKFDQFQKNIPYFAFRQAMEELCQRLSIDAQQHSRLKTEILQAIGDLGQVLVDLSPEFELFLGVQPPLINISPQEARHRFANVVRNFLEVVCRPEHPLVLYIDDWQWADTASFDLLKQLQVGVTLRHFLVIVSYRDNEIDSYHPLESALDHLRRHGVPIEDLQVKNITVDNVQRILADTLKPSIENIEELAAIIYSYTQGNPFFVHSFLNFLYEYKLIWLGKSSNSWQWHIDNNTRKDLPGTMIELFATKLRNLDADSQNLFSLAACLGNNFDLDALSIISGFDPIECKAMLFSDQAEDLLLPMIAGFDNDSVKEAHFTPKVCTFLHDQIQQAARTLIDPVELPTILLKIGRLLLSNLTSEQLVERLFEVMNNLNAGYLLIQDIAEKVKMVELNVSAGRKAHTATAYSSSLLYYRAAARFLESSEFAIYLWSNHHELAMNLFNELAECEFLEGDHILAKQCIQESVTHSRTLLEKASALNVLINQYTLLAKYPEAITAGREALAVLGIFLPEKAYDEARNKEIAQVRQELNVRSVASLIDLPIMSHPEMLLAVKILITMGPPCYRAHQHLWSVIVPKVVKLTLQYGNVPQIGYSHTAFGGLLGWVDNDYATAKEFSELATGLMINTYLSPSDQSVFYLMIGSSVRHWFKHLKYSSKDYQYAVEVGLRSGNLQYAAYAFGHDMVCQFYQGLPMSLLIKQSQQALAFSHTRLNQWAIDLLEGGLELFSTLAGAELNGKDNWSEKEYLQRVEDHHNIQVICIYNVLKAFSLLVSGDYENALTHSDQAEPLIFTVGTQGLLAWPEHAVARMLIISGLYLKADKKQQIQWRTELELMIERLGIWTKNCPENFEHKYFLAMAELAKIDDKPFEAMQFYDQAIAAAKVGSFIQWEGIANERASLFWLERQNEKFAHSYWQQAYTCYDYWGAISKVRAMESAFRSFLEINLPTEEFNSNKDKKMQQQIKDNLIEMQINQIRTFASYEQQIKRQSETVTYAEELADAMQRLRVEMVERKKIEQYEQFRSHTLEMLAGENSLSSILEAIVLGVEQLNSAMRCSIWMLDNKRRVLINCLAPSMPDSYSKAFDGIKIGPEAGASGMAAYTGDRVIVEDLSKHPYYEPFKLLVVDAGLGACWSQPICPSSGQVLGTFSIYHDTVKVPEEIDIYLLEQSARLISIAIEYKGAEEQLKEAHGYINSELEVARNLQIDILPAYFPIANGCDGSARMQPATTMGGDFYDFIELPNNKLGLVMADVSGKGIPAAFFMAVARTTLRLIASNATGPGECLQLTNAILCDQNPMYLFVTIFYAVFDPITGQLIYANGGHNPPVLRHLDGSIELLQSFADTALGVIEDSSYKEHLQQLSRGDSLVLYTDGVTEAFNPEWEEFGEVRLLEQVRLNGNQNAENLVTAIFDSVISFAGVAPQSDDITITVLKWDPK